MTTIQVGRTPVNITLPAPVEIAFTPSGGQGPAGAAGDSLTPDPEGQPDGKVLMTENDALVYAALPYDDLPSFALLFENGLV